MIDELPQSIVYNKITKKYSLVYDFSKQDMKGYICLHSDSNSTIWEIYYTDYKDCNRIPGIYGKGETIEEAKKAVLLTIAKVLPEWSIKYNKRVKQYAKIVQYLKDFNPTNEDWIDIKEIATRVIK